MSAFYDPADAGVFDLGTSQVNKAMEFRNTNGVFSDNAKVDIYKNESLVDTITNLSVVGTNEAGQEKSIIVNFNGSDYQIYKGHRLDCRCTFFNDGDVEVTFKLQIK